MVSKMEAAKILEGLLGGEDESDFITARENVANRDNAIENWMLGPEKASVDPKANADYWQSIADVWGVSEAQARRQVCANCEYYNNSVSRMEQMEAIPLDKYDMDGGGRGYCEKLSFICHSLRTCQVWEEKEFEKED